MFWSEVKRFPSRFSSKTVSFIARLCGLLAIQIWPTKQNRHNISGFGACATDRQEAIPPHSFEVRCHCQPTRKPHAWHPRYTPCYPSTISTLLTLGITDLFTSNNKL